MGWQQMVLGALVSQIAEFMHKKGPRSAGAHSAEGSSRYADPPESDRAVGGKLNPLNAAEDMLKRVIDHAQFRTDQSVRKSVSELQQATEQQWPLMAEQAQLMAERTVELAAERLEGSAGRLAEVIAARTSIVLDEKLARADLLLTEQRKDAQRQGIRLLIIGGVVLLVVGAALIILASVLH